MIPQPPPRSSSRETPLDPEIEHFGFVSKKTNPTDPILIQDLEVLEREGYVCIHNILSAEQIQAVRAALEPWEAQLPNGRNNFEGLKTQRVYGLLAKSRAFDPLILHPRVLTILDHHLLPNYLITALQSVHIYPGENPQPLHFDDGFIPVPRPHQPFSFACMWAIDEFTQQNGGTVVIPGSHRWGKRTPNAQDMKNAISICMPPGSVCLFGSQLWHGGGACLPHAPPRLALAIQYCQPFIRPQENQILATPPSVVETLDPRLQSLIGYSIHPPFIGHADGRHPLKTLPMFRHESDAVPPHARASM